MNASVLKEGDWDNIVADYVDQFRLDGVVVGEVENYQNVAKIICKYLDSEPQ